MSATSYSDVFDIQHERDYDEEIRVGDTVRTGQNLYPHYQVIAVNGDTAWVRNMQTGADGLTALTRCRRI